MTWRTPRRLAAAVGAVLLFFMTVVAFAASIGGPEPTPSYILPDFTDAKPVFDPDENAEWKLEFMTDTGTIEVATDDLLSDAIGSGRPALLANIMRVTTADAELLDWFADRADDLGLTDGRCVDGLQLTSPTGDTNRFDLGGCA